jgi:hypothetical protein
VTKKKDATVSYPSKEYIKPQLILNSDQEDDTSKYTSDKKIKIYLQKPDFSIYQRKKNNSPTRLF